MAVTIRCWNCGSPLSLAGRWPGCQGGCPTCAAVTAAPPRDYTENLDDGRTLKAKVVEHSQGVYFVSCTPLAGGAPGEEEAQAIFDRARNTQLEENPSWRLVSERPCPLGGHPGRESV